MCVLADWRIYATDGRSLQLCIPGAPRFTRLDSQPLPPGGEEPTALYRVVGLVEAEGRNLRFYLEQGGRGPDGQPISWVNQYDAYRAHQGSVEAYDLCADVEGRRVCAILGPRPAPRQPPDFEVLVIERASGEQRSVRLNTAQAETKTANGSLVACDAEGRFYLVVAKTPGDPTARAVQVYAPDGQFICEVSLRLCGGQGVCLGREFARQLVRVDSAGDIYVASATVREGYRIEKYSWQER
jgi:hypothetical protein